MLNTFKLVSPFFKLNPQGVVIDNFVFKLHYRWTFVLLIVGVILVTSHQYVGEPIKCLADTGRVPEKVMNTFCFMNTTFTVVRRVKNGASTMLSGIGHMNGDEPVRRHAYYQWVPFVLFAQALCFYAPHLLWKSWEGGHLKALTSGLKMVSLSEYIKDKSLEVGERHLPSLEETETRVKDIRRCMIDRMRINQSWGAHLVITELLNMVNLLVQLYSTNRFLDGAFYTLGLEIWQQRWDGDVLSVVFPKLTKCLFATYGPAGSLQDLDALCVMALNVINEKIYMMLWFWYVFLLISTALGLIWRVLTLYLHKDINFTKFCFYCAKPGKLDERNLKTVIRKFNFSSWTFLLFLRCNLSEFVFKRVINLLACEFPQDCLNDSQKLELLRQMTKPPFHAI